MKISFITIFPEIFTNFLNTSLIGKAAKSGKLEFTILNIRDFAEPPHFQVDDIPYGGGAGMVLKPEPLSKAISACKKSLPNAPVILLSASGRIFNQTSAAEFSKLDEIIFICARYEGIDQRIIDMFVDHEISIGDYILMGGEVAAMAVTEAVVRLIPDIISNQESLIEESFSISDESGTLIEGPQYTRPALFQGRQVPETLTSGDHSKITAWRKEKAREKRQKFRPDLILNS